MCVGAHRHVFLTTGCHNIGVAQLDVLRCQSDRAQTRAADLVDRPCRTFDGQTRIHMCLTGRVLPLSGGQNLTQNCFIDLGRVDACAGDDLFQYRGAQIVRGCICKGSAEAADRRARCGCDDNVGHMCSSPELLTWGNIIRRFPVPPSSMVWTYPIAAHAAIAPCSLTHFCALPACSASRVGWLVRHTESPVGNRRRAREAGMHRLDFPPVRRRLSCRSCARSTP